MAKQITSFARLASLFLVLTAVAVAESIGPLALLAGDGETNGKADGLNDDAMLDTPVGCVATSDGTVLFADTVNNAVRTVTTEGSKFRVKTIIGKLGVDGKATGTGANARLGTPTDLAVMGANVYFTDFANHNVYKATVASPFTVTRFAGNDLAGYANGAGATAQFNGPSGIVAGDSSTLYLTEATGNRVRKLTSSGTASLVAGSTSDAAGLVNSNVEAARFDSPRGIAIDEAKLYVADSGNYVIRRLSTAGTDVETFAGNGTQGSEDGSLAVSQFVLPIGIAVDPNGEFLYVADKGTNTVRRVDLTTQVVTTVVGSGEVGWDANAHSDQGKISAPAGVCFFRAANGQTRLYITGDHSIARVIITADTTVAVVTTTTTGPGGSTPAEEDTTMSPDMTTSAPGSNHSSTTRSPNDGSGSSSQGGSSDVGAASGPAAVACALVAVIAAVLVA